MPHFLKKIQKNTRRYQNFEKMKEKKKKQILEISSKNYDHMMYGY